MTITEECEKHEMIGCRVCNPRPEDTWPDSIVATRPFPAKYPGQCPECNLPISPGQVIVIRDRGTHNYPIHEDCQ